MRNWTKRMLAGFLALAMLVTMIPVVDAQAATKKVTLYKGEVLETIPDYSDIKSASSSKKSVVSVKKDPESSHKLLVTAKKTGSSTVTIKTQSGTYKVVYTVKALDVKASLKQIADDTILVTVKNNTKQTFTAVAVAYTLKDANGEVVAKDTKVVYDAVAGKAAYATIYCSKYDYTVDISQCSAKVVGDDRSLNAKYTNQSSKVKATVSEADNGEDEVKLTIKTSNKAKDDVSGTNYVLLYDVDDNIIGLEKRSIYLKKGAVDTDSFTIYYKYSYPAYDHYKVVTVAYSTAY